MLALAPDAVVVATGGRASKTAAAKGPPMPVPGSEQDFVLDHETALRRAAGLGRRVVILDVVGHIEAIGLGELLARQQVEVTVVTPFPLPICLDRETLGYALPRAVRAGMRWRPNTAIAAIGEHAVVLVDVLSRQMETVDGVDTVVIRTHGVAEDALYFALQGRCRKSCGSVTRLQFVHVIARSSTATWRAGGCEAARSESIPSCRVS